MKTTRTFFLALLATATLLLLTATGFGQDAHSGGQQAVAGITRNALIKSCGDNKICTSRIIDDGTKLAITGQVVPYSTKTALTAGATVTVDSTLGNFFTLTPAQAESINATTVGAQGQPLYLEVTTSGVTAYVLTFGTNFAANGTFATGTTTAVTTLFEFLSDGTNYVEVGRVGVNFVNNGPGALVKVVGSPFAHSVGAALTSAATIDITAAAALSNVIPHTPTQSETINAVTTPSAGELLELVITTSGTSSWTLTFGTNFKSRGTLATGVVSGVVQTITFQSDGTNYNEIARSSGAIVDKGPGVSVAAVGAPFLLSSGSALTSAATIDITAPAALSNVIPHTPTQSETINAASTPPAGELLELVVTTSGTSSWTLTFGTNFKSRGTLATGIVSGVVQTITFQSDGTNYNEISRSSGTMIDTGPGTVVRGAVGAAFAFGAPVAVTPAATIDVSPTFLTTNIISVTNPAGAETVNYTTLPANPASIIVVEYVSGAAGTQVITFGTNFKPNGTLTTGASGKYSSVTFVWDGTLYMEVSRVTAI